MLLMKAMDVAAEIDFSDQRKRWEEEQDMLKRRLVLSDDFPWKVINNASEPNPNNALRYVAGVDLSFRKKDPSVACGAIVVLDIENMSVVHEDYQIVSLSLPYIPGFLAFRESPVLLELLKKLYCDAGRAIYPQLLMVDGNGLLHPRGFGLACHLGVSADIPTIGIAKNLHQVDGLNKKELQSACDTDSGRTTVLRGKSGQVLGMALRSHDKCKNPIFVSIGHRISLQTAVNVVQLCCKYRIPEPVRQADIRSREKLRVTFGD